MAEAERIGAGARRGVRRDHRRPPSARGAPPVRVAGLRRDRRRLPAQEALTRARRRQRVVPAAPTARRGAGVLLDLPWERPLADWSRGRRSSSASCPVGPSRHLVRFLVVDEPHVRAQGGAARRRPHRVRRPAPPRGARPAGGHRGRPRRVARSASRPSSMTEYLAYSIQYRRLLMRFPLGPGPYRDRLLDAMAWLLVDLHRAGVFWGDCSLANTLFRRDGDKIQAFLVDAETSEIHPSLSDGQRAYDLDILVENVAFGLADLGAMQGREDAFDDAVEAAETVRSRYAAVWDELHLEPELSPDDRHAVRARIRRLNDLGFAVDEIELEPAGPDGGTRPAAGRGHQPAVPRARAGAADRASSRSRARPGCCSTTCASTGPGSSTTGSAFVGEEEAADALARDVLEPSLAALVPAIGRRPRPDPGVLRRPRAEVDPLRAGRRATSGSRRRWRRTSSSARRRPRTTATPATARSRSTSTGRRRPRRGGRRGRRRVLSRRRPRRPARPDRLAPSADADDRRRRPSRSSGSRGLVKRYGDLVAVDGIDFEVAPRRDLRPPRARTAPARPRRSRSSRACARPTRARRRCSASTSPRTRPRSSRASASASRPRRCTRS